MSPLLAEQQRNVSKYLLASTKIEMIIGNKVAAVQGEHLTTGRTLPDQLDSRFRKLNRERLGMRRKRPRVEEEVIHHYRQAPGSP